MSHDLSPKEKIYITELKTVYLMIYRLLEVGSLSVTITRQFNLHSPHTLEELVGHVAFLLK